MKFVSHAEPPFWGLCPMRIVFDKYEEWPPNSPDLKPIAIGQFLLRAQALVDQQGGLIRHVLRLVVLEMRHFMKTHRFCYILC